MSTIEEGRLREARTGTAPWRRWGPYLTERQWGTVREDYSADGDAWASFPHDHARSRAYKWGEDGLAGLSDEKQRLCWALALWNGQDPILKERLFGLTNGEGNHGEDVKECYYYLDSTPTHSWMRFLYKYPQGAFPYADLVATNAARGRSAPEYELLDTGVFDDGRYFDVFVEFAKAAPDDLLIRIRIVNRGPEAATIHVLPHLWFRNTWWMDPDGPRPRLHRHGHTAGVLTVRAEHPVLGTRFLHAEGAAAEAALFTENETNTERLFGQPNAVPFVKDGIDAAVVHGRREAVNPEGHGTKCAVWYVRTVDPGAETAIRLRLDDRPPEGETQFGDAFEATMAARLAEADAFYEAITPPGLDADRALVMRQALAGMLWTKQYYFFDLDRWLQEHEAHPLTGGTRPVRNRDWYHMVNDDVISMPDKWEYPWYAAWDLAFHTLALAMVDPEFAREQLTLMLRDVYMHPNGQLPAYEWNFGDVNPPVHAWATLLSYGIGQREEAADLDFLKRMFGKLLLNFNWWVNRKDPRGRNLFSGGFLGLDNIGVFDRSAELPGGGILEQADGTAWMAFYSLCMLEMAIEIAREEPAYEDFVLKFAQHFLWIGGAMDRVGDTGDDLWDEEDGFFYDLLVRPDGSCERIKVRSMVGLLPLVATAVIPPDVLHRFPGVVGRLEAFARKHPGLVARIHPLDRPGVAGRRLLAVVDERKLRRILSRMLDEERFLSPFGVRSLSRWHRDHPYTITVAGQEHHVAYVPGESDSGMFGGNSNWRGPVWFPVNLLLIRALLRFYEYYGDDFRVDCPTGSGRPATLFEVAQEIATRLVCLFLRNDRGERPCFGPRPLLQEDPHWRDHLLFHEYFHGDSGLGLGAAHQTGWTGTVAFLLQRLAVVTPELVLTQGAGALGTVYRRPAGPR